MIRIKRSYDPPEKTDGMRILVDRIWPRGIKKEKLETALWMKEAAPSNELRKWFNHDPEKWDEFRTRYLKELQRQDARAMLHEIRQAAKKGTVTLVYGAKDEKHNQAIVLKEAIEKMCAGALTSAGTAPPARSARRPAPPPRPARSA